MNHYAHLPPLPKASARRSLLANTSVKPFAEGCYLLNFQAKKANDIFDGTLRLDHEGHGTIGKCGFVQTHQYAQSSAWYFHFFA
jgi:hypothetical protein